MLLGPHGQQRVRLGGRVRGQVAENTQLLVRIHANIQKINQHMQHMEVRMGPLPADANNMLIE